MDDGAAFGADDAVVFVDDVEYVLGAGGFGCGGHGLALIMLLYKLMVQASCHGRARFTADDLRYVVEKLSRSSTEGEALFGLLREPETLDQVLDAAPLHDALLDGPECVSVSPDFYFYVLTRRALLRHGLDDRYLCDYLASMLAAFTRQQYLEQARAPVGARSFGYLSDLVASAEQAPPALAFGVRSFVADYALFLCGVFRERVEAQRNRRGAPGVGFYEAVGRSYYLSAAALPEAARQNVRDVLGKLAEAFHEVRLSLNEMSAKVLHLNTGEMPPLG